MNTFKLVWCSKNNVQVSSMSNLVNLLNALLGTMFVCSKPKIGCSSLITIRWTCSSSFDVRKMILEFVRCLIKWSLNHHYQTLLWNWKDCLDLEHSVHDSNCIDFGNCKMISIIPHLLCNEMFGEHFSWKLTLD